MQKVRVYQLAKELNVQSALILELLDRIGADVKSDLSVLDATTADLVRNKVTHAIDAEKLRIREEQQEHVPEAPVTEAEPQPLDAPVAEIAADPASSVAAADSTGPVDAPLEPLAARPAGAQTPPTAPPQAAAPKTTPLGQTAQAAQVAQAARAARVAPRRVVPGAPPATAGAPAAPGTPRRRVFRPQRSPTPAEFAAQQAAPSGRAGGFKPAQPGGNLPPRVGPGQHRPGGLGGPGGPPGAGRPMPGRPAPPKRRRKKRERRADIEAAPPPNARPRVELPPVPKQISLSEGVTVKELGEKLNRKSKDIIAKLLARGVLATINQPLDPEVAVSVAKEFGCEEARVMTFEEEALVHSNAAGDEPELDLGEDTGPDTEVRPPVVTVMGHVDHGKTSLLDKIRSANIADREAGGITQHIGAYQVEEAGRRITFLDTPGHEAFTMMRARGAKATDIVVLVIAADDGVKPQTREAIDHAKAAGVPIIIAINKVDKPDANPDKVKQQLMQHEIVVEDYGGEIVTCEVSAKTGAGIDHMLEMILLTSELQELRSTADRAASGVVLEARLDRARGVLATVLVQNGTLKTGDTFIAGSAYGKVRAMNDAAGKRVVAAGPSVPVEIMGWAEEPRAGDSFQAIADEAKARQIASFRQEKRKAERLRASSRTSLEDFAAGIGEGGSKELRILLKGDVHGSLEALEKALGDLPSEKIRVNVLRTSIGAITQADVLLATASSALVVGFNVRPDRQASDLAKREGVEIRLYTVIYDLLDDVKQAMLGMLDPTLKETVLGQADVRQPFKIPKIGQIAGCFVTEGKVKRNSEVRLLRDNVVIYTGRVGSLRRFKEDTAEVKNGFECGIGIENYNDIKIGDVLEFFVTERIAQETL